MDMAGTAGTMAGSNAIGSGSQSVQQGTQSDILNQMQENQQSQLAAQAQMTAMQGQAAMQNAAMNAQLQQTQTSAHEMEEASSAAGKAAEKGMDDAKELA